MRKKRFGSLQNNIPNNKTTNNENEAPVSINIKKQLEPK